MTVAVFGAGGFVGRHLTSHLAAVGHEVQAFSSQSAGRFDMSTGLLRNTLPRDTRPQAVIYLAQSPRYRDVPAEAAHVWGVNVLSAVKAAEWARAPDDVLWRRTKHGLHLSPAERERFAQSFDRQAA